MYLRYRTYDNSGNEVEKISLLVGTDSFYRPGKENSGYPSDRETWFLVWENYAVLKIPINHIIGFPVEK